MLQTFTPLLVSSRSVILFSGEVEDEDEAPILKWKNEDDLSEASVDTACSLASDNAGTVNHTTELNVFGKFWIQGEMFVVDVFITLLRC